MRGGSATLASDFLDHADQGASERLPPRRNTTTSHPQGFPTALMHPSQRLGTRVSRPPAAWVTDLVMCPGAARNRCYPDGGTHGGRADAWSVSRRDASGRHANTYDMLIKLRPCPANSSLPQDRQSTFGFGRPGVRSRLEPPVYIATLSLGYCGSPSVATLTPKLSIKAVTRRSPYARYTDRCWRRIAFAYNTIL